MQIPSDDSVKNAHLQSLLTGWVCWTDSSKAVYCLSATGAVSRVKPETLCREGSEQLARVIVESQLCELEQQGHLSGEQTHAPSLNHNVAARQGRLHGDTLRMQVQLQGKSTNVPSAL